MTKKTIEYFRLTEAYNTLRTGKSYEDGCIGIVFEVDEYETLVDFIDNALTNYYRNR